jgi:hypothetical protein
MDAGQLDFGQLDLELPREEDPGESPFDPARIRSAAVELIAQARRAGPDGPWDAEALRLKKMMFPHLVSWLPDADERRQLCFEFSREMERIEALLAA